MFRVSCRISGLLLALLATLAQAADESPSKSKSPTLEGLSAPSRVIEVATAESGLIVRLDATEGAFLAAGAPLVQLDTELLEAQAALAAAGMQARGELDAAQAELELRQRRRTLLEKLLTELHARPEEVERSRTDVAIAKGNVVAAEERRELKHLEHVRVRKQIDQRVIRAPQSGWITRIHKQPGEYVGPSDPSVCTLVQLDPLVANFHLASETAGTLKSGKPVSVQFAEAGSVSATVEFVSPVTDAESNTVAVRVTIPNAKNLLRAGQRCELLLTPIGAQ